MYRPAFSGRNNKTMRKVAKHTTVVAFHMPQRWWTWNLVPTVYETKPVANCFYCYAYLRYDSTKP